MRHREAKYIVIREYLYGGYTECIFVFSRSRTHRNVALTLTNNNLSKVISAGFCSIIDGTLACYGESESLRVMSRPDEDTELLQDMLGEERW